MAACAYLFTFISYFRGIIRWRRKKRNCLPRGIVLSYIMHIQLCEAEKWLFAKCAGKKYINLYSNSIKRLCCAYNTPVTKRSYIWHFRIICVFARVVCLSSFRTIRIIHGLWKYSPRRDLFLFFFCFHRCKSNTKNPYIFGIYWMCVCALFAIAIRIFFFGSILLLAGIYRRPLHSGPHSLLYFVSRFFSISICKRMQIRYQITIKWRACFLWMPWIYSHFFFVFSASAAVSVRQYICWCVWYTRKKSLWGAFVCVRYKI